MNINNKLRVNINSFDQHSIPLFIFKAKQLNPNGIIQIVHGMSEHHEYYLDFINYFNLHGYDIYIHDQRGHGKAVNKTSELGYLANQNGDKCLINDTIKVSEYIRKTNYNSQIMLLGHSMGALVAQAAVITSLANHKDYYCQLILTGTPGLAPWWQCKLGKLYLKFEIARQLHHKHSVSPFAKFLVNYIFNFNFRHEKKLFAWATRDKIWLEKFLADERAGFIPQNQFWIDLINLLEFIRSTKNLSHHNNKIPILYLDGADDPINNKTKQTQKLVTLLHQLGSTNVNHLVYPETRHHLCIEINRHDIFKDILKRLVAQPIARKENLEMIS